MQEKDVAAYSEILLFCLKWEIEIPSFREFGCPAEIWTRPLPRHHTVKPSAHY